MISLLCVCVFTWMCEHIVVTNIKCLCPAYLTPVLETGSFLELGAHWLVSLTRQWTLGTCLSLTHTQAFMCILKIQREVLKLTQQALCSLSHRPRAGCHLCLCDYFMFPKPARTKSVLSAPVHSHKLNPWNYNIFNMTWSREHYPELQPDIYH